MIDLI